MKGSQSTAVVARLTEAGLAVVRERDYPAADSVFIQAEHKRQSGGTRSTAAT
jgi:hypothetical protein